MKKIDLGQTITILANIGVIFGILLLAYELRQNNELMAEQQRFNRLLLANRTTEIFLENPSLAELAVKSTEGIDELTPLELQQVVRIETRVLNNQEWSFRELPRQEIPLELWRRNSMRETWRMAWSQRVEYLDSDFVQFMEAEVINR